MCGIAGVVDTRGRVAQLGLVRRLCEVLGHRGPDDEGYHADGPVALGQRRLAILDLAGGRQPMSNEDGTVRITSNGEIYNFRELQQRLAGLGHRFATRSDTEVIVHAYEQYGLECLKELRGMFAFALWDQPRQTLLLARDRVGKKPLFFLSHGKSDPILPFQDADLASRLLRQHGFAVTLKAFEGGHQIPPEVVEAAADFIYSD